MVNSSTSSSPSAPRPYDYALVGGGLQNGLIALALMRQKPEARFVLLERADRLGGNHLWSFHAGDLSPLMADVVEPLVVKRWARYTVAFPTFTRAVEEPYASVSSDRFHEELCARLESHPAAHLVRGATARVVDAHRVLLANGTEIAADVVIDARGPRDFFASGAMAFQKFVGLEIEVAESLRGIEPIVMDARVPQIGGFRFFYVLPLDEHRLLVEDTYFSDSDALDAGELGARVMAYTLERGFTPVRVVREERGVLPLPHRVPAPLPATGPFLAGYAGGWFHPTTGYSFPIAARLAELVATVAPRGLGAEWARFGMEHGKQARYCAFLNRLLYGAFAPEDRWNVLERFYRLPAPTIRRFYAMNLTLGDRARILCGRPPRGLSLRLALGRQNTLTEGATV